jgi:hypothetical protein
MLLGGDLLSLQHPKLFASIREIQNRRAHTHPAVLYMQRFVPIFTEFEFGSIL